MPVKYKLGTGDTVDITAITKTNQGAGSGLDSDKVDGREPGQVNGLATLDAGGKVPSAQLPALTLTDIWTVGSEAAQLALTAQEGDVAIRTDQNKSYAHNGGTAGTMADWSELLTPTDTVLSVFGRIGAVVAATNDYTWGQIDKTISSLADLTTKSHTVLSDIGTNTHAQIDTHLGASSGVHGVSGSLVGTTDVQTLLNKLLQSPKIKDVDATPVDDVLFKVIDGVLQARNSADSAYASLVIKQLAIGTPTVDGLVNAEGDTSVLGGLFRIKDTKAVPGGQQLFSFTNNTDTVFSADNIGDVEIRRWLNWGEYNTAKYGRLAIPASEGFVGIRVYGTDTDIDIGMEPQGAGSLHCRGRLKLKDVDATPVDASILKVIDGVVEIWNSAESGYGSLKALSLITDTPSHPVYIRTASEDGSVLTAGSTTYFGPGGHSATQPNASMAVAVAGVITRLHIQVNNAPGTGESAVFTVVKNGSDTTMTLTMGATDTDISTTANPVTVAQGDRISIKAVLSAGAAATGARGSFFVKV